MPSSCGSSCNYLFLVTTVDDAGNQGLSNQIISFTIANATLSYNSSQSGGSDDGDSDSTDDGGGGGIITTLTSTEEGLATVSRMWMAIAAGEQTTMEVDNEAIALTSIIFTTNVSYSLVSMDVSSVNEPPDTDDISGIAYQYLKIDADDFIEGASVNQSVVIESTTDAFLNSVKLKFKVLFSWFNDNNIKRSTVKLYRYTGQWDELPTTEISSDSSYAYFEANSPGFSYFVIAGEESEEEPEPAPAAPLPEKAEEPKDEEQETDFDKIDTFAPEEPGSAWFWWALMFIALGGVGAYLVLSRQTMEEGKLGLLQQQPPAQARMPYQGANPAMPQHPGMQPGASPQQQMPQMSPALINYIQSSLSRGMTKQQIRQALLQQRWHPQRIDFILFSGKVRLPTATAPPLPKPLLDYVTLGISRNVPEQQLKATLLQQRWPQNQIEAAYRLARKPRN